MNYHAERPGRHHDPYRHGRRKPRPGWRKRLAEIPEAPPEGMMWDVTHKYLIPIGLNETAAKMRMLMPAEQDLLISPDLKHHLLPDEEP